MELRPVRDTVGHQPHAMRRGEPLGEREQCGGAGRLEPRQRTMPARLGVDGDAELSKNVLETTSLGMPCSPPSRLGGVEGPRVYTRGEGPRVYTRGEGPGPLRSSKVLV